MMLKYEKPCMEIIELAIDSDIVTLSNGGTGSGGGESINSNDPEPIIFE